MTERRVTTTAHPRHAALLAGAHASGSRGRLAIVTASTDLADADADLLAGLDLADALAAEGWGVRLVSGKRARAEFRGLTAVLSLTPEADPGPIPRLTPLLGWARSDIGAWLRADGLATHDLILAGSEVAAAALRGVFGGPVETFATAVDPVRCCLHPTPTRPPVVRADADPAALGHGCVAPAVLEALARGSLPVTNSALGLGEMGLAQVPVHRSAAELRAILARCAEQPAHTAALSERLREIVMQRHTYRHRAAQVTAALPAARAAVDARPVTIGCFSFTRNNPYQELLYADAVAAGVRVVPTWYPMWRGFPRDDGGPLQNQILHVHWTSAVLQRAVGTFSAYRRLDRFRTAVNDFRSRGGQLFWTVHNLLPHDVRHRTLEGELFHFLAEHADRIHVLGPETEAAAAPLGGLPADRVTVIEHSNYRGVYPDFVGRDEARRRLGLAADDRALLLFGEIRPYKGLDLLLEAFRAAARTDPRLRLLIAGDVAEQAHPLLEECRTDPRMVTCFERVPDSDVQVWLRATDLVVLPYRAIVNSGALHLGLTFGRPVIAPLAGEVAALLEPEYAAGFSPGDPVDLARAIGTAVETLCTPAAAASAARTADRFPPERMAADFLALLRSHIDPGCPVPRLPTKLPGSHDDRGTSNEGS